MDKMPEVSTFSDGTKIWEKEFEKFAVKVYVPHTNQPADIVNFGFRAPYLMIFEEKRMSFDEAKAFAKENGFEEIASGLAGSVVFFSPMNEGGWEKAPDDIYQEILEETRISQYYRDGIAITYDRFAKKLDKPYIRGAVLRTYLYGYGASADYIAKYCMKTIEGQGLYGRGDVTPAGCILQGLSVLPEISRRDLPVVSIGNSEEINEVLKKGTDYLLIKDKAETVKDFHEFVERHRRMVGNLEEQVDFDKIGMVCEPSFVTVKTTPDNRGDDKDTEHHKIGYVAYYNRGIMDGGKKVPLVMCFHGGGDSAFIMASTSGWYRIAQKNNFLLICVEHHMNSTASEAVEMIGILKQKYSIDETRIYSTGFSMGGCKTWDLMQEYPQIFAAVAPMDATFEVGCNVFADPVPGYHRDVTLPVFYAGGEITPLPELPFQAQKCVDRMGYVFEANHVIKPYNVKLEEAANWQNKIWGIDGDASYSFPNPEREGSILSLELFESEGGKCYSVFACVGNQMHEVRHHTCENAWKFLSCFRRLPDGTIEGGDMETIKSLYA